MFWNIYFSITFGAHKLVHSEPFWTTYTIFDNCCQHYVAICGKIFYIGAHLHSRTWTTAVEFSSNLSAIYTKSCAKTFLPIFGLFKIFGCNIKKIVAPFSKKNKYYLVHLKGQSVLKKQCKQYQNWSIIRDTTPVQSMSPLNEQRAGLGAWQKNKKITYKHHVFAPTAGTHSAIFPKLCMVIELVVPIKKGVIHLSIQRIGGCTENFGLIDRCAVSQH